MKGKTLDALGALACGACVTWMIYDWVMDANGDKLIQVDSQLKVLSDEVAYLKKEVRS